jgi:hypothetical protein
MPGKKSRNRTLAIKTTPEVKLTYYMYAAKHDMHVVDVIEQVARCLEAGGEMSLRDCLEKGESPSQ